jgi:hypothetical protein
VAIKGIESFRYVGIILVACISLVLPATAMRHNIELSNFRFRHNQTRDKHDRSLSWFHLGFYDGDVRFVYCLSI